MSKRYSILAAALAASGRNLLTTAIDGSGHVLELETPRNDGALIEERRRRAFAHPDAGLLGNEPADFAMPRQIGAGPIALGYELAS